MRSDVIKLSRLYLNNNWLFINSCWLIFWTIYDLINRQKIESWLSIQLCQHFPLKIFTIKQTSRKSSTCLFWIQLMSTTRCCTVTRRSEASRVPEINATFVSHTHTHTHTHTRPKFLFWDVWSSFASLLNFYGQHMKTAVIYQSWMKDDVSYLSSNEAITKSFTNNLPTAADLLRLTQLNQPASLFLWTVSNCPRSKNIKSFMTQKIRNVTQLTAGTWMNDWMSLFFRKVNWFVFLKTKSVTRIKHCVVFYVFLICLLF